MRERQREKKKIWVVLVFRACESCDFYLELAIYQLTEVARDAIDALDKKREGNRQDLQTGEAMTCL